MTQPTKIRRKTPTNTGITNPSVTKVPFSTKEAQPLLDDDHPRKTLVDYAVLPIRWKLSGGLSFDDSFTQKLPSVLLGRVTETEYHDKMIEFQSMVHSNGQTRETSIKRFYCFMALASLITNWFPTIGAILLLTTIGLFQFGHQRSVDRLFDALQRDTEAMFSDWSARGITVSLQQIWDVFIDQNRNSTLPGWNLCFYVPISAEDGKDETLKRKSHSEMALVDQFVVRVTRFFFDGLHLSRDTDTVDLPMQLEGIVTENQYREKMIRFRDRLKLWNGGKLETIMAAAFFFELISIAISIFDKLFYVPFIFNLVVILACAAYLHKETSSLERDVKVMFEDWMPRVQASLQQKSFHLMFFIPSQEQEHEGTQTV